jgi:UDP-glucose 4-epimerase
MRYLVTGGAGFIGSHLTAALLDRDDQVLSLDDLSTGSLSNVGPFESHDGFEFVLGSVLDQELVADSVAQCDAVVHLAAAVGVKLIVREPLDSLITNIRGTENILEACSKHGRRILLTSTSEIYGKNTGTLHEDADRILGSPYKARWSYSTAKSVDEILANAYWRERGLPTVVVRLFNTVGPGQTGDYGMVIPTLISQALRGQDLTVYGSGDQSRCFCHVQDAVRGLLGLMDHPGSVGLPYNVGRPEETSINHLAERIITMTGSSSPVVHVPYEQAYEEGFEDMERRVPDISRVHSLTGWQPDLTLDDILADVIEHERLREVRSA